MDQKVQKRQLPKEVYTKAVLMGIALLLLVAALVFFTAAWYTKMVSTAGIDLQAAQWEFTANHTIDDVTVNVLDYETLEKDRAAPGTAGIIPITLGARQAETNVDFILEVDRSTMSEEFQKRIFFYYYDTVNDPNKTNPIYFGPSPDKPADTGRVQLKGSIPRGDTTEITICWEWVYDIYEIKADATPDEAKAWDEFDTKVGENPELYRTDMNATLTVVGLEVRPKQSTSNN